MLFSFSFCFFYKLLLGLFFFSCPIHANYFLFPLPPLLCIFCGKSGHLFQKKKKYKKYPCQSCCFRTNASFKEKKKKQQQHQSLLPFFLLMTWTVVDFDNNLCLVLVPYLSSTFPKHGQHIREYADTHSPEAAARICDDAAASRCLRSTSCILPMAASSTNGTFTDISQIQGSTWSKPLNQLPSLSA